MILREYYLNRIKPFIDTDLVKVLTGIRRCGKSVMLELIKNELRKNGIAENRMLSYNFEENRFSALCNHQSLHDEIIAQKSKIEGRAYLFFDEIQEVKQWEKCINSLRVTVDCDIFITGSNAKLLSGELATYLAGRYIEFTIYPFSFTEFWEAVRLSEPNVSASVAFKKFLLWGGMPYLHNLRYAEDPSRQYLRDIFNSVQLKDIVLRNKVRDVDLLSRLLLYIIANVGTTFSARSIVNFFRSENRTVSVETVLNYLNYCCDAYLIHRVKREDLRGKKILSTQEKYYIADHGIRQIVYGNNQRDISLVLENVVFTELLRRGYEVTVGRVGDLEVDFVCTKNGEKCYIQVAYLLADESVVRREFGVYDAIKDHYPKYVISMDEFDMSRNGIKHVNLITWLTTD